MLPSPSHAVIGSSDLASSIAFLRLFGFEPGRAGPLPAAAAAALYGIDGPSQEMLLGVPGASSGWLRLVATPNPEPSYAPLDNRPFAVDLFSTDIERSVATAADAGFRSSPVATHRFGPVSIKEVEIEGPDGLIITLLETTARRPSILDIEPDRLHSEVHALVWSVKEIDRLLPFWEERAGHQKLTDVVFDSPELGAVLGVSDRQIKARLAVLGDAEANPVRLEMIEFLGEPAADHPTLPLGAGLHGPAFSVADLEAAASTLHEAEFGEVVEIDTPLHREARAVSAVAPGGLRFELWQEREQPAATAEAQKGSPI